MEIHRKRNSNRKRNYKKCSCFLCQEEGHYANECLKIKKKSDEMKRMKEIKQYNLEPKEDTNSEPESIYYLSEESINYESYESSDDGSL